LNAAHRLLRILLCGAVAMGVLLPMAAAHADPTPQDVEQQLEQAHNELEDVIEDYNRISEELKATQADAASVAERLAPLQGQMDAARAGVADLAASAYKTAGDLNAANVMLSANSTNTLVHQVEALDRIARVRQREIAAYADAKTRYEQEKQRLDALIADQRDKQQQMSARKEKIEADIKKLEDLERRLEEAAAAERARQAAAAAAAERARQAAAAAERAKRSAAPAPPRPGPPPSGTGKGAIAVRYAYAQLGKMYRWGAAGPNNFDCSGLTMMAWRAAGVSLPHNAAMQYRATPKVSRAALQPGDLVYYRNLGHVGIYLGNGQIIHAYRTGMPIAVHSIDRMPPYGYSRPG
jgi:cell wall-associated NlpC family hydrolase